MGVRIVEGRALLEDLGERLDALHAATHAPVTARRPWLEVWVGAFDDMAPWAVLVEDGVTLAAAALLARRRARGLTRIVALGHGPTDYARVPALDADAAALLARGLADAIRATGGPWELRLDGLPPADPVARGLARALPNAGIGRGKDSPVVRFSGGRELRPYLGANLHRKERKMRNRARRDGLEVAVEHLRDPQAVALLLPEMEHVRRARDADALRGSDLADPRAARFWREAMLRLVGAGEAEVTVVRLGGRLAAYLVGLVDPPHYRMWDGRFAPELSRYSPGTLSLLEAMRRALADRRFEAFDLMRGALEYKAEVATDAIHTEYLRAWSSPGVRLVMEAPERVRRSLRALRGRSPALGRAWVAAKRAASARRGPR